MHSFFAMGLITVIWAVVGYSIAFGPDTWNGLIGNPMAHRMLKDVPWNAGRELSPGNFEGYPALVFMAFQLMFAIITPALITGAFAERVKFRAYFVFMTLWSLLIYSPLAHWVWGGGLLAHNAAGSESMLQKFAGVGAMDFAGGTVVHISSGVSALVFALLIGRRRGYPQTAMPPNNLVFTMLGAGILWFGWYGFNGGSALASNGLAGLAFVNTHLCCAMAAVIWALVEKMHRGKASALGFASGVVAGLVCITPAAGFVEPWAALLMGIIVSPICYSFVTIVKVKCGYDDSLDAFGVHGIGGSIGAILTGLLTSEGLTITGSTGLKQAWAQLLAVIATWVFVGVGTFILVKVIDAVIGIRLSDEEESAGLDLSQHGEVGYNI
jgi:Amt family ammonium transporter